VSESALHVDRVETSLEVALFDPTRHVRIHYSTEQQAQRASDHLNGHEISSFSLAAAVESNFNDDKMTIVRLSAVPYDISEAAIQNLLPADLQGTSVSSGPLSYILPPQPPNRDPPEPNHHPGTLILKGSYCPVKGSNID
jgi:hypothetical protein